MQKFSLAILTAQCLPWLRAAYITARPVSGPAQLRRLLAKEKLYVVVAPPHFPLKWYFFTFQFRNFEFFCVFFFASASSILLYFFSVKAPLLPPTLITTAIISAYLCSCCDSSLYTSLYNWCCLLLLYLYVSGKKKGTAGRYNVIFMSTQTRYL